MDSNSPQQKYRWHVVTKKKELKLPTRIEVLEVPYLQNDQGGTVETVEMSREFEQTFLYRDNQREFRFVANRWDEERPTSTYVVRLHPARIDERTQQIALQHLDLIESALKAYPSPDAPPATKVIFNDARGIEPPTYRELTELRNG